MSLRWSLSSLSEVEGWHAPAGRRTCETPASDPGQADQTGSAGGCLKTWGPADKSISRQPETASADSEVRPGPRPRTYAHTTAKPRKQGRDRSTTHILPADSALPAGGEFVATERRRTASSGRPVPAADRPGLAWARCWGRPWMRFSASTRCAARSSGGNCAEVRDDRALPADESGTPSYDGVLITVWVLAAVPRSWTLTSGQARQASRRVGKHEIEQPVLARPPVASAERRRRSHPRAANRVRNKIP